MKTTTIHLTKDWYQATDGTKTLYIDPVQGAVAFCISDTRPQPQADHHMMKTPVTVTPPTRVWLRSTREYKKDTFVTISETG
ncbi:hypothetical protein HT206_002455 [Salmonella enterica]|nr:hypothetical protein [Salmonella enterica]EKD5379848.1 hypothetical protein [Salmonella enterica subsp. enterica serovar Anatum]